MPTTSRRPTAWVCADCDETFKQTAEALAHAETHDHWLYEHPHGFRGYPPLRSMHASDHGGCYLDPVDPVTGRRLADDYRRGEPAR